MATVYIDGNRHDADAKQNMLHVSLSLGYDLPFFCWHPAMGSIGACRQCAVKQFKDEKDTKGRLVMACLTPALEDTRISIADQEAQEFRAAIIEGLMLHHPHDCPVCDEGGECHLQDMTYLTGHAYRRYRFQKRTYRNQFLGPFVNHEMNRCIQCYRCVRFYRGYAGEHDLNSFSIHHTVYFGRHEDGILESEFSGNLAEVCPTGVFTDRTLGQHYTRKWDQTYAPSICHSCGVGCNISPGQRDGIVRRILNRYNHEVNGYFICDRGRFSYEYVNSPERIRAPLVRRGDEREVIEKDEAVKIFAEMLGSGEDVIGIGSPRASLEANFALRALVGADRFFSGFSTGEQRLIELMLSIMQTVHVPSLREVEACDAVLILGEDVTNVAARMALALRQSARREPQKKALAARVPLWDDLGVRQVTGDAIGPVFIAFPCATRLDDVAEATYRGRPDQIAQFGYAVAAAIHSGAPPANTDASAQALVKRIAEALRTAERPLVVSGATLRNEAIIGAAANIVYALEREGRSAGLAFTMPEANTCGLGLMRARALEEALESRVQYGTVVILENDLYRRATAAIVDEFLARAGNVVVLDQVNTRTAARANLVLPVASFAESAGTLVNFESRAQRFFPVLPPSDVQESWRWITDVATRRGEFGSWNSLDDVTAAVEQEMPIFRGITAAAPPSSYRIAGEKIPRQPHRYSGRTATLVNISIHEPPPPDDPDSPLAYSMEGYTYKAPASALPFLWAPGWNSARALLKFQEEINGPLRGGPVGIRLIRGDRRGAPEFFSGAPEPVNAPERRWLAVPIYHLFGSDELTHWAPAISSLAPQPYVAVNERAGFRDGAPVAFQSDGATQTAVIKIRSEIPDGVAAVPAGLRETETLRLPAWISIEAI
ncbi:MAG: NADH-quinone oxidoreductase subunit NuoG [Acidobacteria bacterium]|nr:NADH-quinone oxidoreductase subunit NuoG [Acidobacteriota bacterium]